jgi:FeS assembly SUF system protein
MASTKGLKMSRWARIMGLGRRGRLDHDQRKTDAHEHAEVEVERRDPEELREPVIAALRTVHDPEIPVNIYDLGLIYRIEISPNGDLRIDMTLTAPACPVAGMMPGMVEDALRQVDGVGTIRVELVWDPPWTQERMSQEARLDLGII